MRHLADPLLGRKPEVGPRRQSVYGHQRSQPKGSARLVKISQPDDMQHLILSALPGLRFATRRLPGTGSGLRDLPEKGGSPHLSAIHRHDRVPRGIGPTAALPAEPPHSTRSQFFAGRPSFHRGEALRVRIPLDGVRLPLRNRLRAARSPRKGGGLPRLRLSTVMGRVPRIGPLVRPRLEASNRSPLRTARAPRQCFDPNARKILGQDIQGETGPVPVRRPSRALATLTCPRTLGNPADAFIRICPASSPG
jgi:hypothetical protein